jgi:hypothetical protein
VTQATNLRQRARKLITFANGLLSIARDLEAVATRSEWSLPDIHTANEDSDSIQDHPYWLELARRTYSDRRRRSKYFALLFSVSRPGTFCLTCLLPKRRAGVFL